MLSLIKKRSELDKNISELTEKAEKEIQSFKSNSIKDVQTIASQVSRNYLKSFHLMMKLIKTLSLKRLKISVKENGRIKLNV